MTGDCPNCLVNVDGEPGRRSCTTAARDGQRVRRETGWPSTERDLLAVTDRLHPLLPVGFYSKTFIRPRFAWAVAERVIRRATGVGRLPVASPPRRSRIRYASTDVLVIGAGPAGLAAALAAAEAGHEVLLADEGRPGERLPPGPLADRVAGLAAEVRSDPRIEIAERHVAVGVYDGPFVPLAGDGETVHVEPGRIVVATGAVEVHGLFEGNDVPGVWLGRGAARLAGSHGVRPAAEAVVAAGTEESVEHIDVLRSAGVRIGAVLADGDIADAIADTGVAVVRDGRILGTIGRRRVEGVRIAGPDGARSIPCDALVVSIGLVPRDDLLRLGDGLPVVGAGDVALPGCSLDEAIASGRAAGRGDPVPERDGPAGERTAPCAPPGSAGTVCLCEDVGVADLEVAWSEGWTSAEILKRYTTATMGPCQGAMCGRHLACFAERRSGGGSAGGRTTARPPARPVRLEQLAAGVEEVVDRRTSLHEAHVALGARIVRSGSWQRPATYGDAREEYLAVRERVGVMDVGTLGKFLIGGPDAPALVDRVFPCRVDSLEPGRSRYLVALDEAGYVIDDGLLCRVAPDRFFVTSTSGGADRMEAWLRNWVDRYDLDAHVVNMTSFLGAILVAGPHARGLLDGLTDDPIDAASLPHMAHAEISVAGVRVRAVRSGFVGELGLELHHARSRGPELWDALLEAGRPLDLLPHGLDALDVLRLEKGHLFLGQDTLPDDHPAKLGLDFAVAIDKPAFVGRDALLRLAELDLDRRLVGLAFDGPAQRGVPLSVGDRVVGRVTSCAHAPALRRDIGLGWVRAIDGAFPERLRAGEVEARVAPRPFYDPEGARLRA
jgi:sarcosine oxidase subunit alpha